MGNVNPTLPTYQQSKPTSSQSSASICAWTPPAPSTAPRLPVALPLAGAHKVVLLAALCCPPPDQRPGKGGERGDAEAHVPPPPVTDQDGTTWVASTAAPPPLPQSALHCRHRSSPSRQQQQFAEKAEQQGTAQKKAELPPEAASVEGEKSSRRERRTQSSRSAAEAARPRGSFANRVRGEQVAAGWPVWLSALPLPLFFPVTLPLRTSPDPSTAPPRPSPSLPIHTPAAQSLALILANEEGIHYSIDLGRTNFRVLRVEVGAGSVIINQKVEHQPIPKELTKGTTEDLFNFVALALKSFLEREEGQDVKRALGFTFSFPVRQNLVSSRSLIRWIKGFSIEDTVLAIPAITMSAGLLFGSVTGTIIVSIRGTLAATVAFLIARYFAKERILKLLQGVLAFISSLSW
ncbi:hypothetical protein GUJ93_ZPchr0212g29127 [Zizania palustris]|uniref:Phosphotransferase n=1 Tax=Zizania palustris TaxID=103762 RepID=A0A8J5QUS6_ZIZPA|nr:hypothetical protein GUJ93_ZPchr0212g29127 [Zizania palustris]